MKQKQFLAAVLSVAAITSGTFISSISSAQPCPLSSKQTSTNSAGQSPPSLNSTTIGTSVAGIALLGGLLAAAGVYWFRRRQSDSVTDEANYEVPEVPSAPVVEQKDPERELVGNRK